MSKADDLLKEYGDDDDDDENWIVFQLTEGVRFLTTWWVLFPIAAAAGLLLPHLASGIDMTYYAVVAQVIPVFVVVYAVDKRRVAQFAEESRETITGFHSDALQEAVDNPNDPEVMTRIKDLAEGIELSDYLRDSTRTQTLRVNENAIVGEAAALVAVAMGEPSIATLILTALCGASVILETVAGSQFRVDSLTSTG